MPGKVPGRSHTFWSFVIRAVLWALAELPIEGIPGTDSQQLPSVSLASLLLQRGFWKCDRQAIFTRAPLSSSSKHSQQSRHGRTVRCPGLIESVISILIIHLKLIKANLGMQECQAKQKMMWCYYVVASDNKMYFPPAKHFTMTKDALSVILNEYRGNLAHLYLILILRKHML